VTRPVYSAALNEIFKIDINATNKSDDELRQEITEQLKKAGIDNMQIEFERDTKGNRMMKFFRPLSSNPTNDGFDMTIKDGNNVNRLKEVRRTGEDHANRFKGKTDAEIKQIVKENFGVANLKDDQIVIIREGDKINVKVKVKNHKNNMNEETETEDEIR
jgi:hypothetical protein